jgi:hypothetical protein
MTTSVNGVKYATSVKTSMRLASKVAIFCYSQSGFQSMYRSCVRLSGVLLSINCAEGRPCCTLKIR